MLTLTLAAFSGGILWAILGIGFLIFVHEYGHYSACRLTGTRVDTFSIGFGPRLFGWERSRAGERSFTWGRRRLDPDAHAMDFRVALIPLGGYVKMAGENPGQPRSGAPDEFASQSIAERLFIVSAGVIMNAVTAFVLYAVAFMGRMEKEPAIVGSVKTGSPAWVAGVEPGDRVRSVDGNPVSSFVDLKVEAAFLTQDAPRPLVVERDGSVRTLTVAARYESQQGVVQLGVGPAFGLRLTLGGETLLLGPEERAEVEGVPVRGGAEAALRLQRAFEEGATSARLVLASGRALEVPLGPAPAPGGPSHAKIGIQPADAPVVELARGAAAGLAAGDVLVAAEGGGVRVALEGLETLERLPALLASVERLEVTRAGAPATVPVEGVAGRAAVLGLVRSIALREASTAARPVAAGRRLALGDAVYRYPSVPAQGRLAAGERILKVGAHEVSTWSALVERLREAKADAPVALAVAGPDGATREVLLTPVTLEAVGTLPFELTVVKEPVGEPGFGAGLAQGAARLAREVKNTFRTIGSFFTGNISFQKNIAGPVTLVNASSRASEESFLELLWFLAYVSVMLAVLNILPIPVLDGGHVVFLLAEKLRGRPLSDATIGRLQLIGLVLLLTLMVFALKNDVLLNF